MQRFRSNVILGACLCLSLSLWQPGWAETFVYPAEGDPAFSIDIPDRLQPEVGDDGIIYPQSPAGDAWIIAWTGDEGQSLDELAEEIDEVLSEGFRQIEFDDSESGDINGLPVSVFNGQGVEIESGEAARIGAVVFEAAAATPAVLFAVTYEDTSEASMSDGIDLCETGGYEISEE